MSKLPIMWNGGVRMAKGGWPAGKKHSPRTIAKMKAARRKQKITAEMKAKIKATMQRKWALIREIDEEHAA